jgi:hypothetical protein
LNCDPFCFLGIHLEWEDGAELLFELPEELEEKARRVLYAGNKVDTQVLRPTLCKPTQLIGSKWPVTDRRMKESMISLHMIKIPSMYLHLRIRIYI